jgi:hypothetical protein
MKMPPDAAGGIVGGADLMAEVSAYRSRNPRNGKERHDHPHVSLGNFAAGLAAAGLPVLPLLPLLPRTKQPRHKGAYKAATCDPLWIDQHWYHHPDDNIGVRPPIGMVVVDIDPRNGGKTALARLIAEHGRLPDTWTARTGSGGRHVWLAVGEMTVRAHLCEGVDIKHGGNGFVVAPPSVHPDGGRYEWLQPPFGEPAAAPTWLREMLKPPVYEPPLLTLVNGDGGGRYSLLALVRRIEAAPEGQRNRTTFGACRDAAGQGDLDAFADALAAAAVGRGLPLSEVETIVRSARGAT